MDIKRGAGEVDPSFGRDAALHQLATSDLSVEEKLSGGADIDALIAADVLEDDDQNTDFPPSVKPEELVYTPGPPIPEEEFQSVLAMFDKTW